VQAAIDDQGFVFRAIQKVFALQLGFAILVPLLDRFEVFILAGLLFGGLL